MKLKQSVGVCGFSCSVCGRVGGVEQDGLLKLCTAAAAGLEQRVIVHVLVAMLLEDLFEGGGGKSGG